LSDVVVVGGGVGGLAGAIACAAAGHRVIVLEAAAEAGGKLGRARVDGVEIDTGPSVLTLPHVFDEVLAMAGAPPLQTERPARWFRYTFPDGAVVEIGNGLAGALDGVRAALGAKAAEQLARYLDRARVAWEIAAPRFVFGDAPGFKALASASPRELAAIRPFSTLWQTIEEGIDDPRLRAILARFATYAGSDVRRAPAVLSTIAWVELGLGGFGVRGGMYRLAERLVLAARGLGVEFRFGAPVESLLIERGAARGARLRSGETVHGAAVLCNTESSVALGALLPPGLRREVAGERSWSGRCAVLRVPLRERAAHEVRFPADYLREMEDLSAGRSPRDPALYLCAPRVAHSAPGFSDGTEAIFTMTNIPAGSPDAPWTPAEGERVLWERGPAALARQFPGSEGALYGLASHSWRTAFQRPRNRVAHVRGLYLAGGSAHPGAGLPLAASSGLRAAAALCKDLRPRRALWAALGVALILGTPYGLRASPNPNPSVDAARRLLARAEIAPHAAQDALRLAASDPAEPRAKLVAAEAAFRSAELSPSSLRLAYLDESTAWARSAVLSEPRWSEGHFWLAVSLAAAARERGLLALLGAADEVRTQLHEAERLDPRSGPALSALCGLYHRAPGWPLSFGDDDRARGYCQRALAADPRSWEAHLALADLAHSHEEAIVHLNAILEGPLDPLLPLTHARYRREARERL
jgi:1-hydroxycarotenoid 3,4-desaturase